ncbi:oxidoreductase [Trichococcus flocculiformis]|uniref:oxidoreductase n=1 Tax=Trichococcus flocculiformis TaxID=82803 RepID=UPI002AAB11D2|nr:oxidoreductase [Trichococcus flocculiformis]
MEEFKALWAENTGEKVEATVRTFNKEDLPDGEVLVEVHYSSVNYKDGLAGTNPKSGVIRNYPMILGIDLSGVVVESLDPTFQAGDKVIVTGYGLGVSHFGGFSQYARVPAAWVVPLPEGLSLREAMIFGTAGYTAAESVDALEKQGIQPQMGNVLVTGASGGVGGMAIAMLKRLGYTVEAVSRKKADCTDYLKKGLGAEAVLHPDEVALEKKRPLAQQRWAAIVDPVGGPMLPDLLAQLHYGGCMALSGNAGGIAFEATVLPFILRGVKLVGIDSVSHPYAERIKLWGRMASDLKPENLDLLVEQEITLEDLPVAFEKIMEGKMHGRTLVKVKQGI